MDIREIKDLGYCKTICLVGSTQPKWKEQYRHVEEVITKAGYVVHTVVWFRGQLENFEEHRPMLERVHFQKIRNSDAVVLIHQEAKGEHTTIEMEFARTINRPIFVYHNNKQILGALDTIEGIVKSIINRCELMTPINPPTHEVDIARWRIKNIRKQELKYILFKMGLPEIMIRM